MNNTYVVISYTGREARFKMNDFVERLRRQGIEYKAIGNQRIVNVYGDEIHFIIRDEYEKWSRGRTYYLDGRKYKSGYLTKDPEVRIVERHRGNC